MEKNLDNPSSLVYIFMLHILMSTNLKSMQFFPNIFSMNFLKTPCITNLGVHRLGYIHPFLSSVPEGAEMSPHPVPRSWSPTARSRNRNPGSFKDYTPRPESKEGLKTTS